MKQYRLNDWNIDMILRQNNGFIEDSIEGCLLDDLYITTKRGYMLLLETSANCWSSVYTMYFDTKSDEIDALWESRKQDYYNAVNG